LILSNSNTLLVFFSSRDDRLFQKSIPNVIYSDTFKFR
jgi:hypothetical protein